MLEMPTIEDRALPAVFDRPFFLNQFVSTHQSLLLRSPKGDLFADRVDVLFKGVVAVKLVSKLQNLTVREASSEEAASVAADCGAEVLGGNGLRIFMLDGGPSSAYVVALSMFASRDQRHGSNPSPLLFDVDGEPVPDEVFLRYG
ncbi:hypothetical protein [Kribbella sp. VKM Ac-2568]|uniref:hypothetical protein n=1 Tax=Kribbella sp. VKM Ac-2568 TaxID=2512219 RepID=UPI001048E094|nr:hypothetical protein [Kribbella sp. VKM Ac-2568]TCM48849.1 hypothetical protein EV648_103113 [Kribbella sp. VKM Ac-2568]